MYFMSWYKCNVTKQKRKKKIVGERKSVETYSMYVFSEGVKQLVISASIG